ncbi:MAG: response regulator [Anaerolineaceae bacterium]|nr:response regulator [Anaerolineaceae bacterium]MCB9100251.1 response regulator [Anaerolineales bacterium]
MGLVTHVTQPVKNHQPKPATSILVLDSNPNLRYLYVQALQQAGYQVFSATTIHEARKLLTNHPISLFLSDTHINNQDQGIGLMYEQLNTFAQRNIKTIMMSSHVQYERVCQEMGVDIFIEKPVAIDRLVTLVNRLI